MKRPTILATAGISIVAIVYLLAACDELITEQTIIEIAGHPIAEFTANKDQCCTPCTVQFQDLSQGPYQILIWNYGDGVDTVDTNNPDPIHIYDSAGTYQVILTVKDTTLPDTGQDSERKKRFLIVGSAISDVELSDTIGCPGSEITFTPLDTGGITGFTWNFGDGTPTSNEPNPSHTYNSVGQYVVTLTLTSDDCPQNIMRLPDTIRIQPCPVVKIYDTLSEYCAPLEITLFGDSSATHPQDTNQLLNWTWNLGNGSNSPDTNPTTTYETPGEYVISMAVTSTSGFADTAVETLIVYGVPTVNIGVLSATTACGVGAEQFLVKFADSSSGDITDRTWYFGDGFTSTDSSPIHAFTDIGVFDVKLVVDGPCGRDSITEDSLIILYDEITSDDITITVDPETGDTSQTFTISGQSAVPFTDREWIVADSSIGNVPQVTISFDTAGVYPVTLRLTNVCGTGERTDSIVVTAP